MYFRMVITPEEARVRGGSAGGKRVAVIGAGAGGLCAAKYMKSAGFDVTVFELGSQIGGLWCYMNDNGLSSAYRTLHINTSRGVTQFHDLPFDDDVQPFPDHWDMHKYLVRFAEHFGITPLIRFNSEVMQVTPALDDLNEAPRHNAEPKWALTLKDGTVEIFDIVIAATGHLSEPNHVPMFRDNFAGEYLHSHYYKEPEPFVGKRVCIVGVGNSALDITGDVCVTAPKCVLVARSGALIMPKLLFGQPVTDITHWIQRPWLPDKVRRWLIQWVCFVAHGDMRKLGFRPMTTRTHATSNGTIVTDIAYRRVEVKHEIAGIEGKTIHFSDGTSDDFDVLIGATGYEITLPYISPDIVPVEDNGLRLYKRMVRPGWPGLFFFGFFNTDTALNMIYEHQARWIREIALGNASLPSEAEMWTDIAAQEKWVAKYYKDTSRHRIEEEHVPYIIALKRSLKLMQGRAKRLAMAA